MPNNILLDEVVISSSSRDINDDNTIVVATNNNNSSNKIIKFIGLVFMLVLISCVGVIFKDNFKQFNNDIESNRILTSNIKSIVEDRILLDKTVNPTPWDVVMDHPTIKPTKKPTKTPTYLLSNRRSTYFKTN